jgi:hypothetical protein
VAVVRQRRSAAVHGDPPVGRPLRDPGYPTNSQNAPLSGLSAEQDFSVPDGANKDVLNRAIWQSVRGAGTTMPAPVGATDADG